ncbi:hypothetical protein ACP70R_030805 [Stipagrostis hirtigluma subsp. patula]
MQPFSRHAGFFASLQRVEHRLASDDGHKQPQPPTTTTTRPSEPSSFLADTMTGSPLLFLDPAQAASTSADRHSSGPALDFLTLTNGDPQEEQPPQLDDDDDDIARLMALLGLSPPRDDHRSGSGGSECDCSGADGFLAKVVGVVGPKCDGEKSRLDAWIHHYHSSSREPARLAHLLLAKASCSSSSWGDGDDDATNTIAFPPTVKDFLDHQPPPTE